MRREASGKGRASPGDEAVTNDAGNAFTAFYCCQFDAIFFGRKPMIVLRVS